jgi:hypothetical protein
MLVFGEFGAFCVTVCETRVSQFQDLLNLFQQGKIL